MRFGIRPNIPLFHTFERVLFGCSSHLMDWSGTQAKKGTRGLLTTFSLPSYRV
jgi:hypothetical protein